MFCCSAIKILHVIIQVIIGKLGVAAQVHPSPGASGRWTLAHCPVARSISVSNPHFSWPKALMEAFTGMLNNGGTPMLPQLLAGYGDAEVPSTSSLSSSLGFHEAFCKGATLSAGVPGQFYPALHLRQHQVVFI